MRKAAPREQEETQTVEQIPERISDSVEEIPSLVLKVVPRDCSEVQTVEQAVEAHWVSAEETLLIQPKAVPLILLEEVPTVKPILRINSN